MKSQMIASNTRPGSEPGPEVLLFRAGNSIGTMDIPVEVGPATKVGAVTESIAGRLSLPQDVPYGLRDDNSSVYLDDDRPIGEQIAPGAHVSVVPRAHLGGSPSLAPGSNRAACCSV